MVMNTLSIRIGNLGDCSMICYDKTHGKGCDVVLECSSPKRGKIIIVVEIKECYITRGDAKTAVKQINECYEALRSTGSKTIILRYLVHDRSTGCGIDGPAMLILKHNGIRYLPVQHLRKPPKKSKVTQEIPTQEIIKNYRSSCR